MEKMNDKNLKQTSEASKTAMFCGASDCETSKRLNVQESRKQKKFIQKKGYVVFVEKKENLFLQHQNFTHFLQLIRNVT